MKRQWTRIADFDYNFLVDEREIGKMKIDVNSKESKAFCSINGSEYEVRRTGFWRSHIEITNSNQQVILKVYPEKWYANSWQMEWQENRYKLIVRNNPLAEYAVTNGDKVILAYGLDTENSELRVRISSADSPDFILDFLLWYLFYPIVNENFGNTYSFLIGL